MNNSSDFKKINQINSETLREIAKYLLADGHRIFYIGHTWTKADAVWIYFDTVFDIEQMRIEFQLADHIVVHENLDIKSGTEKGFIDMNTGEGIMGLL